MHSKDNTPLGTFPTSFSQPYHVPGQGNSRSLSNLTGVEKSDQLIIKHGAKESSSTMHGSDIDQYMDHIIEEEAGLYSEATFLEGDNVDGSYDAFSPLHAEEHNSAMQTPFRVPPGHCNTLGSRSAGVEMCANQTLTSQKEEKTNDENRRKSINKKSQSKTMQMKLPFAGRKRLIDEFFDTGEEARFGIGAHRIDSSTIPHAEVSVIEADVEELDGFRLPGFPHKKHASSMSAKPSRVVEKSNKPSASGFQGVEERKGHDVTVLKAAVEPPTHETVNRHFPPPGPTPCSFFAVAPGDRYRFCCMYVYNM